LTANTRGPTGAAERAIVDLGALGSTRGVVVAGVVAAPDVKKTS